MSREALDKEGGFRERGAQLQQAGVLGEQRIEQLTQVDHRSVVAGKCQIMRIASHADLDRKANGIFIVGVLAIREGAHGKARAEKQNANPGGVGVREQLVGPAGLEPATKRL
ncbi:hypothetical protein AZKH_1257 [Azoarcus sp. KH32C]|nr:hypothetical protein AZKH_1257 [Azoarcus sp. KH32C]